MYGGIWTLGSVHTCGGHMDLGGYSCMGITWGIQMYEGLIDVWGMYRGIQMYKGMYRHTGKYIVYITYSIVDI